MVLKKKDPLEMLWIEWQRSYMSEKCVENFDQILTMIEKHTFTEQPIEESTSHRSYPTSVASSQSKSQHLV